MIDENVVQRIAETVSDSFIIGNHYYEESPRHETIYRAKFEAGLAWLYTFVLRRPIPKVVYCNNLGFLKLGKNKMDPSFDHKIVEERLHQRITVSGRYEKLRQEYDFDSVND